MERSHKLYFKTAILFEPSPSERLIKITFPWSKENLSEIKNISGRKWHKEKRYWTIPLTLENCLIVQKLGYKMQQSLKDWGNEAHVREQNPITTITIPGLKGTLFPYQNTGVSFLENFNGRGLIADEMGLGKTIQAIAYLQLHLDLRPVIVVCPATLKLNWEKELIDWMPHPNVIVLSGTNTKTISNNIIVINYDILHQWVPVLKSLLPKVVILDESHYIKNSSAKRTKATKKLCKGVQHVIALSGTPIENKPLEIFNTINIIDSTIFDNPWKFKHRYCGAKHNGFGWDFNGSSNVKELHEILIKRVMIRRKKANVLKDLPPKIYSFIPLEINNRKEYRSAERDFIQYVRDGIDIQAKELMKSLKQDDFRIIEINHAKLKRLQDEKADKATALTQIEVLKQLAVQGKLDAVMNWIEDFLESGEKLIVFATHKFVIESLINKFRKLVVKIDGSVSSKKRQEAVELFQNSKRIKLFIGNIKAAGIGITLTAASNVAFIEYPWSPGELLQAADRAHRIGQKFTVNIHYLLALNTIEEKIARMLDDKQKVLDAVLDGKETETTNLLSQLINNYK